MGAAALLGVGMAVGGALGLFGGGNSQQQMTRQETTLVNETVFRALSESRNVQQVEAIIDQDIELGDVECYGNFEVVQSASITVNVVQEFTDETRGELVSKITQDLAEKAEQTSKQMAGFANFIPNSSVQLNETITDVTNEIEQQITTKFLNEQVGKVVIGEKLAIGGIDENGNPRGKFLVDPTGLGSYIKTMERLGLQPESEVVTTLAEIAATTTCRIDQNADINYVAQQIGSKITEIISTNEMNNKLKREYRQYNDQVTEGAGDAIGDAARGIGEGISAAFGGGALSSIVSCASCAMLIIGGGMVASQGQGNNAKGAASFAMKNLKAMVKK